MIFYPQGEGDDYNFQFDDNFDSYEEMSDSQSDNGDDSQQENYPNTTLEQSPYRFMNGKDGMGKQQRFKIEGHFLWTCLNLC